MATGSKDKTIGILDTNGTLISQIQKAHKEPINITKFISDSILVSGDDEGCIKVKNEKNNLLKN